MARRKAILIFEEDPAECTIKFRANTQKTLTELINDDELRRSGGLSGQAGGQLRK
jgi:hypothetical protein